MARMKRTDGIGNRWIGCALAALALATATGAKAADDWAYYGHDAGGQRFSPLTEVNRANVGKLQVAWTFHTGDINDGKRGQRSGFETTPLYIDGRLYLTTPFNRVIALEPTTGHQLWAYDPKIDLAGEYGDGMISRGVAAWRDPRGGKGGACTLTLYEATLDARLVAVDAATGKPCAGFGAAGEVSLRDVPNFEAGPYHMTSPPAVVDDTVIVGSAINDNTRVDMASGVVRAFDARSGRLKWSWQPLEPHPGVKSGAANAWSVMTVDPKRHLVFIPTGSASPDYYGGLRPGDNHWANSVVAIDARTGRLAWGFQLVHHDLWDYDVASPPMLTTIEHAGRKVEVVIAANKSGFLYVLDRDTGKPVFPVEERSVPQSTVDGEVTSPTQPFSVGLPTLAPQSLDAGQVFATSAADKAACKATLAKLSGLSIFSPPSVQGVLAVPGNVGGPNWSGFAFDPTRGLLIANTNNFPYVVKLIPRADFKWSPGGDLGAESGTQKGAPYAMSRAPFLSPSGVPCAPPPWGMMTAIDLNKGTLRWRTPFGGMSEINASFAGFKPGGSVNLGGAITTAGGLVFVGASIDRRFHALDIDTGKELWTAELPASAHAMPMTYSAGGTQYVVIAAGGSAKLGQEKQGDALVAFALSKGP